MAGYQLIEFKKVASPLNSTDEHWYFYLISNQFNSITGYRQGNKNDTRHYLKQTIQRLNQKFTAPPRHYQRGARKVLEPNPW